ncbi:MAG: protein kinase [Pirellulales bacterium]
MSQDPTISQNTDDLSCARRQSSQRLRPPTEVPGYEFERFLGAGAYGEVWVAVDRNTSRRTAIKFYIHRGGVDWSLLSREVEKLAFLFADRYVVQLIDVGWDANPPYYVMEYLENGSLADRIQSGPIPASEAVSLFRDVTIGLIHAHDKGVLHCDLKPANVLLDQDGRPRLADFGQSRLSHEQTPALGTLFYMAPEQADLGAMPDARWDVYALGALLYCMLCGEPPHRSPDTLTMFERAPDLAAKLTAYRKYLQGSPPPTRHRDVPGVDRDLADIITKCLQPNPNRRFPNPQAVLDALEMRTQRRARRPLLVLGAVGPAVLLAVLSWFAWSVYRTSVRESDEALTKRAVETNLFAAQFVAEAVAGEIDRRWQTLEQEATDRDLREQLARISATDAKLAPDDQRTLQTWIERTASRNPDVQAASWTMMDARGNQLARVPYEAKTVGKNYAYRDYFNGQGGLPEGTPNIKPIETPHLSNVFVSTSTQDRKVAFSVPVWSVPERDDAPRRVIGVFSVTVALGHFAELRTDDAESAALIAALVDAKPDSDNRSGAVLEHPELAELAAAKKPDDPFPAYYFDESGIRRLNSLTTAAPHAERKTGRGAAELDYRDPLGGDYEGRWIAAMQPVVVDGRPPESGNTGWVVVVQERYEAALKPAQELGAKLLRYGMTALGVVVLVITTLWGFVMIVLNEAPRWKFATMLRRSAGLSTTAVTGASNSVGGSSQRNSPGPATPAAPVGGALPTLTMPRRPDAD